MRHERKKDAPAAVIGCKAVLTIVVSRLQHDVSFTVHGGIILHGVVNLLYWGAGGGEVVKVKKG